MNSKNCNIFLTADLPAPQSQGSRQYYCMYQPGEVCFGFLKLHLFWQEKKKSLGKQTGVEVRRIPFPVKLLTCVQQVGNLRKCLLICSSVFWIEKTGLMSKHQPSHGWAPDKSGYQNQELCCLKNKCFFSSF